MSKTRNGLLALGTVGIFVGIGIILYALLYIRPKAAEVTATVDRSLETAEKSLHLMSNNAGLFNAAADLGQASAQLAGMAPETLTSAQGTLIESAALLERTGATIDQMESGISGIALPGKEVGRNATQARKAADQLRLLAGMIQEMKQASARLEGPAANASSQIARMKNDLPQMQALLLDSQGQIRNLRGLLDDIPIGIHSAAIVASVGGIYCFLGFLFLTLAGLHSRLDQMAESDIRSRAPRRAA